jgi:predicted HicB family RNase H-like nuclease
MHLIFSTHGEGRIRMNSIKSKQVNTNKRSVVTIDPELHRKAKVLVASQKTTLKALVEGFLAEVLEVKND